MGGFRPRILKLKDGKHGTLKPWGLGFRFFCGFGFKGLGLWVYGLSGTIRAYEGI